MLTKEFKRAKMRKNMLNEGDHLPSFNLKSSNGGIITNKDLFKKDILFFIYPKDNSPSCTKDAHGFSDYQRSFVKLGVKIYGVSNDTILSHEKFINKHSLSTELLSDERNEFITSVGAWVEKSMYGKQYMGIERTTILLSTEGKISKIWRKVRVPGHVEEVFKVVTQNLG